MLIEVKPTVTPKSEWGPDRIHFVGIGGVGMNGIAQVLLSLNHPITGSDIQPNAATERLKAQGATIYIGHKAEQGKEAHVLVVSSAVADDNPEVLAAKARNTPVLHRSQMLAEIMRYRYNITIAGTHGKTTVSSLASTLLMDAGKKPTYIIGGQLCATGRNAAFGGDESNYLVAEADESDGTFVQLFPSLAVVTSLDPDHLVNYGGEFSQLRAAFLKFLHELPDIGIAHLCIDHPEVRGLIPDIQRDVTTYGFAEDADIHAYHYTQEAGVSRFKVATTEHPVFTVELPLPGRHNVQNALATISIGLQLKIDVATIQASLKGFQGIKRRFEVKHSTLAIGDITWIDDYAHHPDEIIATLDAVHEGWPEHRVVVAYQPHRYTRTKDTFTELVDVLSKIENLILCEIYAAGEPPIAGADGATLSAAIQAQNGVAPTYIEQIDALPDTLQRVVQAGDIVLTMGAGNIGQKAESYLHPTV